MFRSSYLALQQRFPVRSYPITLSHNILSRNNSSNTAESIRNEKPGEQKVGWTTIYKFPYIGIVSALNKTKWYQLGATVLGCPFAYAMEMSGEVGAGTSLICAAVGISATLATTAFSRLSSGTVGFFYLSDDESKARFGFVDSNGRRHDAVADVDQVVSRGENRFFIRFSVPETEKLQIFHNHGIISDVGKFNQVL